MTVRVLTTCHTQYTWDSSICIFLFNRTTLQVFVTYVTGALYLHPLWFHKNQHENQFRSELFVACQRRWFQWQFWFAPSLPGEIRNYCTQHIIKENFENFLIHRCNYILLSQVYCVWQVVKTLTFILNNPVHTCIIHLNLVTIYMMYHFIHSLFCLTTGPKPPPKRCLHIVRSRASSFKWEYPLLSLRSSSSF